MTDKIDFKKRDKHLYKAAPDKLTVVDVPPMHFLAADGFGGDPSQSAAFQDAIDQIFSYAYTMKFANKKLEDPAVLDFVVPPLECLWWNAPGEEKNTDPTKMHWRLLSRQPDFVTQAMIDAARDELRAKGKLNESVKLDFIEFAEGRAAQLMHVGPYDQEQASVERLCSLAAAAGLTLGYVHHEIYLSDPRRTAPEKLKTILRYQVTAG